MLELTLTIEDAPAKQDLDELYRGLREYNYPYLGRVIHESLAVFLRDAHGLLVGGVLGETSLGWLEVHQLWVHQDSRGKGYGRALMHSIEQAAVFRGCRQVLLDTFSFQAPAFYRKLGYEITTTLDYGEHQRFFLVKRLS